MEERANKLRDRGRLLDSVLVDALASAAVSETCEVASSRVFSWAQGNKVNASRAFEPGSGSADWPLANQRLIFANLISQTIGVTLSPHFLMHPVKSISFVMGLGPDIEQASSPLSCEGCKRVDCAYRLETSAEAR